MIEVSKEGLSEEELKAILHIDSGTWSPIFFAMASFILDRAGLYRYTTYTMYLISVFILSFLLSFVYLFIISVSLIAFFSSIIFLSSFLCLLFIYFPILHFSYLSSRFFIISLFLFRYCFLTSFPESCLFHECSSDHAWHVQTF